MHDESGAHVAPGGSRLGSMPADSGGVATPPRAPGPDVPLAPTARAPGQDCLSAAPRAPGHAHTPGAPASAPEHGRLSAAWRAPGHERPLAAPRTVDYHWSGTRHRWVPAPGRFPTALRAAGHGRLSAALLPAPGPDVPLAVTAGAPGQDRLRAALAPASVHAGPHVTPSPPPGHDCSRRAPAGAEPRPTSVTHPTTLVHGWYAPTFTPEEVQQFIRADAAAALWQLFDAAAACVADPPAPLAPAAPHASKECDP